MPEMLTVYLNTIGAQIRWKQARSVLLQELECHAAEQLDECLAQGLYQEEAEAETLRQLGDPVEIGQELDRLHRPKPQWGLLALTALLALAGTILPILLPKSADAALFFKPERMLLWAALAFAALLGGYFLNYSSLIRHSILIYLGALVTGLVLLWWSPTRNNSALYPHYAAMLFPMVYALLLIRLQGHRWRGFAAAVLAILPLCAVPLLAPRLLDVATLLLCSALLLVLAAKRDWFGIGKKSGLACTLALLGTSAAGILWFGHKSLWSRLYQILHPNMDPLGRGYMPMTIRSALAGAKPWGTGEMTGRWSGMPFWSVVPNVGSDTFPVALIHFMGWVPFLLLYGSLCVLLLWAAIKTIRQKNSAAQMLALSVLAILGIQALLGLLMTCSFILCRVSCPLLSMSAETTINMGLIGLLLSIFRQETLPYTPVSTPKPPKGRWKLVYIPANS